MKDTAAKTFIFFFIFVMSVNFLQAKEIPSDGVHKQYYENEQLRDEREYKGEKLIWVKKYDENGNLREEFIFDPLGDPAQKPFTPVASERGLFPPVKEERSYYTDGQLHRERFCEDSERKCTGKEYYETGEIKKDAEYHYLKHYVTKRYYRNGNLKKQVIENRDDKPRRRHIQKYYETGQLSGEGIDGVDYKTYYETGELKSHSEYQNGIKIKKREFRKTGSLHHEWILNEEKEWLVKSYYEGGKLQKEETFTDRGGSQGLIEYYENGAIKRQGDYQTIMRHYYPNGKVKKEIDNATSLRRDYYPNGNLHKEAVYKDGKRAVDRRYFQDGTLQYEKILKGKNDYIQKSYHPNGNLWGETLFKEGKRHGSSKSYYPSGALYWQRNNVNGKTEGTMTVYYENGQVQSVAEYKNNLLIEQKNYSPNGVLTENYIPRYSP